MQNCECNCGCKDHNRNACRFLISTKIYGSKDAAKSALDTCNLFPGEPAVVRYYEDEDESKVYWMMAVGGLEGTTISDNGYFTGVSTGTFDESIIVNGQDVSEEMGSGE